MAVQAKFIDDEAVLCADTEEDFALALETGLPVFAPPEITERFGFAPDIVEDVGTPEDILLGPDDLPAEYQEEPPLPIWIDAEPERSPIQTLFGVAAWAAVFIGALRFILKWTP